MRRAYAMLGLGTAVLLAAASLTLIPRSSQASSTEATFLVPAHDGYGVADCLVSGHSCGQAVADTWCEAQGYVRATSFRQVAVGEVTGSVQKAALTKLPQPVSITCTN
ncbi:hypothetical protein [Microvirga brassicacearum]|jgi:hypothetical protein|uniref:Secreted protein n=1 Tax=Microvirga brassicacearum TaxID=2580413 RepID=A0A5N3PAH5_9HYPH|nr:hypothetical protein [Microvirga brassicacearum]KAB0266713.1 hypothetical protein FEZ63_12495 [Microvirga brassicacearum]